jgi:hypothetical protein
MTQILSPFACNLKKGDSMKKDNFSVFAFLPIWNHFVAMVVAEAKIVSGDIVIRLKDSAFWAVFCESNIICKHGAVLILDIENSDC